MPDRTTHGLNFYLGKNGPPKTESHEMLETLEPHRTFEISGAMNLQLEIEGSTILKLVPFKSTKVHNFERSKLFL